MSQRSREWGLVAAWTGLGAALRLFGIGSQSLWLDELFSVFVARRDLAQVIVGTVQGDTNPPLFNVLLHLALQFGSDEVAARAVSVLFGVAAIPLFYLLARYLFNSARVANVATALLATNPFQIAYAQEARMYAQLAFFSLAAMFFFLRAWRNGRRRDWVLFVLATTLAFYTHSLAFLNLLALDAFVLTQRSAGRERWRGLALVHVTIVILFLPWLAILGQQAARVQSGFWGAVPSPLSLITTAYLFLFSNVVPLNIVPVALFVGLASITFALIASARTVWTRRDDSVSVMFALSVLMVPLLALFLLSLIRPIFIERTLLPASFGLYLLLARSVVRAEPRALNHALGVIVLLTVCAALLNYYFDPTVQKPPMRDAARALAAQFQPGDVVVHTSDSSALAFMYYAPDLPNHFLASDPDYVAETTRGRSGRIAGLVPEDVDTIVTGHSRVWLVVALDHNVDYQKTQAHQFDERFKSRGVLEVGKISLLRYEIR